MDKRKEQILKIIIKEHIKTAEPVGSEVLVGKYKLGISPATVRNEMAELEDEGFIVQPHTSAGRVPTEKAYRYYLKNLSERKISASDAKVLDKLLEQKSEHDLKQTAKALAQMSGSAVFLVIGKDNFYYTGISYLFHQPEFSQADLIYDISEIIDHLDEIVGAIWPELDDGMQVYVGSKNPISDSCSTIINKYRLNNNDAYLGMIGPVRMNYEKNLALMKYIQDKLINA